VHSLFAAADPDVTRLLIHAGSWSQYGAVAGEIPITEHHSQRATTAYGKAKAEAEALGFMASREHGVPFVSLRLFNVFGPREGAHRLIPYVVRCATEGSPAILTSGSQVRDFVYVDDAVNAFMSCTDSDVATLPAFNVATGVGTSVRTIAEMAVAYLDADPALLKFGQKAPRIGEATHVVGDSSALSRHTGWSTQVPVSGGVRDTVQWAMDHTTHDG